MKNLTEKTVLSVSTGIKKNVRSKGSATSMKKTLSDGDEKLAEVKCPCCGSFHEATFVYNSSGVVWEALLWCCCGQITVFVDDRYKQVHNFGCDAIS